MNSVRVKANRSGGIGGRIFGSLFFLVFFGMGALFCFIIGREFYLNLQTRSWPPTDCVIIESHIDQNDSRDETPYEFVARYEYEWQGQRYSSTNYSRQPARSSDYSKLQRLASRYPSDSRASCFVDPSHPEQAVLERSSLWIGLLILLPLLFVGIGAGFLMAIWGFKPLLSRLPGGGGSRRGVSTPDGRPRSAVAFQTIFFSCFLLVGLGVLFPLVLAPLRGIVAARHWTSTECTIISSHLRSHHGNKGTTYEVDILYAYQVEGREFRSNRYKFLGGSSSGRRGKADTVQGYLPGSKAMCFVNPRDPLEAVLDRGFTPAMWFGLIPAVFCVVGVAGIRSVVRRRQPPIMRRG